MMCYKINHQKIISTNKNVKAFLIYHVQRYQYKCQRHVQIMPVVAMKDTHILTYAYIITE